ncbi:hypothetical protein [Neomoorella glycerini]|nr:hypothetical protein [Moorella glycerini]
MDHAVSQALQLMAIALPTMFGIILLFIGVINLLTSLFPGRDDEP